MTATTECGRREGRSSTTSLPGPGVSGHDAKGSTSCWLTHPHRPGESLARRRVCRAGGGGQEQDSAVLELREWRSDDLEGANLDALAIAQLSHFRIRAPESGAVRAKVLTSTSCPVRSTAVRLRSVRDAKVGARRPRPPQVSRSAGSEPPRELARRTTDVGAGGRAHAEGMRILVHLSSRRPLEGWVSSPGQGGRRSFYGWLGLIRRLADLVGTDDDAAVTTPAGGAVPGPPGPC